MVVKSVDVAPSMQQHQALAGIGPCKHPPPRTPCCMNYKNTRHVSVVAGPLTGQEKRSLTLA